jgi:hypothetical protein
MIVTLEDGRRIDAADPIDISIPLRFNGPQPNAYGVEPASAKACEYGTLVGDTRRGGSCNFEQYTFIPHCSGTHTECVGHITNERISVRDCLRDAFIPASLLTIATVGSNETDESYPIAFQTGDRLITAQNIRAALPRSVPPASAGGAATNNHSTSRSTESPPPAHAGGTDFALIVRTLPNDDGKLSRHYDASNVPPYFTTEAMRYLVELGCKHLLVDLPSIDRLFDDGHLSNHRVFWNVQEGSFEVHERSRITSTITELIYVPEAVADGHYLLNLQIAPFAADASPSRPLLFSEK